MDSLKEINERIAAMEASIKIDMEFIHNKLVKSLLDAYDARIGVLEAKVAALNATMDVVDVVDVDDDC